MYKTFVFAFVLKCHQKQQQNQYHKTHNHKQYKQTISLVQTLRLFHHK